MIAAEQYTRRFWPVFIAFPVFGILAIIFGPNRGTQAFGVFCLAWPLSIPARSVMITSRLAKRFAKPTTVIVEDGTIFFSQGESGMKLTLDQLRRIDKRKGFYILETKLYSFAPLPIDAFGAKTAAFESLIDAKLKPS
jgi:hypothetical protein